MDKKSGMVVDSSVAVKWVNNQNEEYLQQANAILKHAQKGKISIIMPELAKYEIGNALLNKGMNLSASKISLTIVYAIPIQFISQDLESAQESMGIAQNSNMIFYDASFIVLAKRFKADLITDNPKHQKKYKGKDIKIIALKEYK